MGIPNETICIDGLQKEIHDAKMRYFRSRMLSGDVVKDKLGYLKLFAAQKVNKELGKKIALRKKSFEVYSKRKFHVSRFYGSKEELRRHTTDYAAILVGSDQLWLPSNIAADLLHAQLRAGRGAQDCLCYELWCVNAPEEASRGFQTVHSPN